jgi:hypothetical protein
MGTDGSVQDPVATYLCVISISQTEVKPYVKGSGFLPPTAQAVYGSLFETSRSGGTPSWAKLDYANHTGSNPPPLLIPVDNEGVVKDVHRTINGQMPSMLDLLSPDCNILVQAIRTCLYTKQTLRMLLRHTKIVLSCGMNLTFVQKLMCLLTNKQQADDIYSPPARWTRLFPST